MKTEVSEKPPGEWAPYPFAAIDPMRSKPSRPEAIAKSALPATRPARTWVTTYAGTSRRSKRLAVARPMVTAGLKWPPET